MIFFSPKESISYANTNLPKSHFRFNDSIQIYWLVELIPYRGNKKENRVYVKDYAFKVIGSFNHQVVMRELPYLRFEELDSDAFLRLCLSYDRPMLEHLFSAPSTLMSTPSEGISGRPSPSFSDSNDFPTVQEYPIELTIKFSGATIVEGAIVFVKQFERIDSNLVFEIPNPCLKAVYDPIKEYLAKKLGRKTFVVKATIKRSGRKAVVVKAQSEEIALINESFIQSIKYKQIKSLLKVKQSDGRPIHSVDEVLLLSDELKGNLLETDVQHIIDVLTRNAGHRNSKQLGFLARRQDLAEVVYITVSPYFGFVFYLRSGNRRSYIWELLDSHATYCWSFESEERDRIQEFDVLEQSISEIRQAGRNAYKSNNRNVRINLGCEFDTIQHAMLGRGSDEMFEAWRRELKIRAKQEMHD